GSGHVGDEAASLVRALDIGAQVLLRLRPGELHDRGPQCERGGETVFPYTEQKKVEPERFIRLLANGCGALLDLLGAQTMAAQRAEAAGIGHGGNKFRVGARSHPAQGDGVLDTQQFADWGLDHHTLLSSPTILIRKPVPTPHQVRGKLFGITLPGLTTRVAAPTRAV